MVAKDKILLRKSVNSIEKKLKTVYVDASLPISQYKIDAETGLPSKRGQGIIVIVVENGRRQVFWDVTANYQEKVLTHEAEFIGIIFALQKVRGDLLIKTDSKSAVEVLTGKGRITNKTKRYVTDIRQLSKSRNVNFTYEPRETNKAGLKLEGLSFLEIDTPELLAQRLELKKELRNRRQRIWRIS